MKNKLIYGATSELKQLGSIIKPIFKPILNIIMPLNLYIFKDIRSGELFSFVYIGWDKKLCYYWVTRFSDEFENIRSEYRIVPLGNITEFLKKNKREIDLAIIEANKKALSDKYPNGFLLPKWMEMELNIESSLKTATIQKTIKFIKKYSLKYEIREGVENLDLFYYGMYRPHTLKRHGKSAYVADYRYFYNKLLSKDSVLFFLLYENEPIAAIFIEIREDGCRLCASGIKDGNDDISRMRVNGALHYFIMKYYYEKGINILRAGSCMPVVFDGVMEYKLRLGAKPYLKDLDKREKYYFMPINSKLSTEKVLKSNPLIYFSGKNLNIAVFVDGADYNSKEDFFKFFNRVKANNVEKTRVFYFENPGRVVQWINEEAISNVEFLKYKISN